jgi:tellurite resistance-related uncharacterized protein
MERAITGYHLEEEGDWVAELSCGHNQHVRHRPPFQLRPWVLDAAGRAARRGSLLDCPLCERAELPEGLRFVRSTPVWNERTLPQALRQAHRVGGGTWGRIMVHQGRLRFRAETSPPLDVVLDPATAQAIPPDVEHEVAPLGPVRLSVEFLAVDRQQPPLVPRSPVDIDEGGDPACWAHLVDEETGTIGEEPQSAKGSAPGRWEDRPPLGHADQPGPEREGAHHGEKREAMTIDPGTTPRVTVPQSQGAMGRFTHDELVALHRQTLSTPRRSYGIGARVLFALLDAVYGKTRTLSKFKVLELVARVPYQSWEQVAYIAITDTQRRTDLARRIFDRVTESRAQQDNEQWHLLILEERIARAQIREGWARFTVAPQVLAFAYYQLSWLLYAIRPAWSYRLNADFEDHAEHEYAHLVDEHPDWDDESFESAFAADYGQLATVADLFRQISYDERVHKEESLTRMTEPRFS